MFGIEEVKALPLHARIDKVLELDSQIYELGDPRCRGPYFTFDAWMLKPDGNGGYTLESDWSEYAFNLFETACWPILLDLLVKHIHSEYLAFAEKEWGNEGGGFNFYGHNYYPISNFQQLLEELKTILHRLDKDPAYAETVFALGLYEKDVFEPQERPILLKEKIRRGMEFHWEFIRRIERLIKELPDRNCIILDGY